jgi:hypothetical protein
MKSIKVIAFDRWESGGFPIDDTYAVSYDGVDDYSQNTSIPYATLGSNYSFAFWIKPSSDSPDVRYISCRLGGTSAYFEVVRQGTTGGKMKIYFKGTTGTGVIYTSNDTFPDNEWHHCMITWNGTLLKIYSDGVLDKFSTAFSGVLMGGRLRCGGYAGGGINSVCILDELAFWDTELSETQVSEVYAEGIIQDLSALPLTSASLVHWWRMGDGDTFPTLQDSVGALDMTMYNMTASDIVTDTP